jgi:membrane protease YdiL (CAAX protease family)
MKEIGYEKRFFIRSIILGLISSFVIISLFVGILNILPLFNIGIGPPKLEIGGLKELLYRLLIRIPIGTAYFEENLFRGICYGYLVRKYSIKKTTIITSFLFSIWHIVPALKVVNSNFQIPLSFTGILFWIGGLFGAFLAGIFFAILRDKGKNISGCILSHALINDLSLLVIYYLWK